MYPNGSVFGGPPWQHAQVTGTDSGRTFYAGLLEALTEVMGSAKGYLRDHGPMVAMLSTQIGKEMGLSKAER